MEAEILIRGVEAPEWVLRTGVGHLVGSYLENWVCRRR